MLFKHAKLRDYLKQKTLLLLQWKITICNQNICLYNKIFVNTLYNGEMIDVKTIQKP